MHQQNKKNETERNEKNETEERKKQHTLRSICTILKQDGKYRFVFLNKLIWCLLLKFQKQIIVIIFLH